MFKPLFIFLCLLLFATYTLANNHREPQLQQIFQQGMYATHRGNYQLAIEQFRKMLKINPNLARPRLELARTLYKKGDYQLSKYHFEQVLSMSLPSKVRANIKHFLNLIDKQLPSFNLSLDLSLNEKIPKKTKTAYVQGIPFENVRYKDTGIHQHAYIFSIDGKIPINTKAQTFAKFGLQHSDINGSNNAKTYLTTSFGKHFSLPNSASITPEVGLHHLIYHNNKLYNGGTFSLHYFKPIDSSNYLNLIYNNKQLNYVANLKSSTSKQNKFSIRLISLPSISSRIDSTLSYLKSSAQDKSRAFNKIDLAVSYNRDIGSAWNIGVGLKANRTHYQAGALFDNNISKKDRQKTLEFTLLNNFWQINNIAPKLYIGQTVNKSNIDVYEKANLYVKLGFTQEF